MPRGPQGPILVVFHEEVLGGATRSVLRAIPHLERRGWKFVFWVPRPSSLFDELRRDGHEVHGARRLVTYSVRALRLPPGPAARLAGTPAYLRRFGSFVRAITPVLVHSNSLDTLAEALIARLVGAPVLLHAHEMVPLGRKGLLARLIAHASLQELVAVSDASAEALGWRARRPRVVHEAAPVPPAPVPVKADPRPFVVGTVGVISRRKGSDVFVEAARRVLEETDRVELHMIGALTDPLDADWGRGVIARAHRFDIHYVESANVSEAFAHWDAFVLPSRKDPFPIAMLEAMAAGLPVIGTRVDGIEEQLAPGSGVLIDGEDPEALARAILRLSEQPESARAAMGAAARGRVQAHFTIEHQAAGLHDAYLAAAGLGSA